MADKGGLKIDITPPVRAVRTAVYNAIYDAEDRLILFGGMSEHMDATAVFIAKAINEAFEVD
jgi:hypothetical protein